jgi:hypothetical protein
VGGVVGGVVGASAIVGIFLFSYYRHKHLAAAKPPPRSEDWEGDLGAPNPFQNLVFLPPTQPNPYFRGVIGMSPLLIFIRGELDVCTRRNASLRRGP